MLPCLVTLGESKAPIDDAVIALLQGIMNFGKHPEVLFSGVVAAEGEKAVAKLPGLCAVALRWPATEKSSTVLRAVQKHVDRMDAVKALRTAIAEAPLVFSFDALVNKEWSLRDART